MFYKMNVFTDILNSIGDFLSWVFSLILSVLPPSPFQKVFSLIFENEVISDVLGYINTVCPVSEAVGVLQVWIIAVGGFYLYQIILRWTKSIG